MGDAGNAISVSTAVYPELKGRAPLSQCWYPLDAWKRYEVPLRTPPMPAKVLLGLVWFCVRKRQLGMAFPLLASFDAFLRTGEMLSLYLSDVCLDHSGRGIIKLAHTKTW